MSQSIISRTISSVVDQRLVLSNGQAKRTFSYLTSWNVIRIGMLISFDGTSAANLTGTPLMLLAIMKDTANGFGNPSADHVVGARTIATQFTYNAGSGNPYFSSANPLQLVKKIGSTVTAGTGFGSGAFFTANQTAKRNALILEITKGSPNFTISAIYPTSATIAQFDVTPSVFEDMMNASSMANAAAVPSTAYSAQGGVTIAIDETTNGFFNGINLFWDKTANPLEISVVRHRKIS